MIPHGDGGHQVGVAADEGVIADGGVVLGLAVVVAGDGAAAEVAVLADGRVAQVGQVADGVAHGKVGVLGLHIGAQVAALGGSGTGAHMGERPDLVVGADVALVALAGVDGGTFFHHGIFQQGVGADDAPCADFGGAAQDAPRQDGGAGGDLDLRLDVYVTADELHAVLQVAFKRGGIALLRLLESFFCG